MSFINITRRRGVEFNRTNMRHLTMDDLFDVERKPVARKKGHGHPTYNLLCVSTEYLTLYELRYNPCQIAHVNWRSTGRRHQRVPPDVAPPEVHVLPALIRNTWFAQSFVNTWRHACSSTEPRKCGSWKVKMRLMVRPCELITPYWPD